MTDDSNNPTMTPLTCAECGHHELDFLADHILEAHGLTVEAYQTKHPGHEVMSWRLIDRFDLEHTNIRRKHPPAPDTLTVDLAGIKFPVNWDVPAEACLPMPDHYRLPRFGILGEDIQHALIALYFHRSQYIWGLPGSGKDALFHAWSAMTRWPAIIKSVKPGTDIESWFFSRAFNEKGTYWEEGEVLKALRDGYRTSSGRVLPYLILVSDLDRADRSQAEHMRLITDSIQGRIDGPAGTTFTVLPGTIIAATGNTAGAGDERGRMVSSNPLDASVMERFHARFQFHWMDWRDESEIIRSKFPILFQRCPSALDKLGNATRLLREAILGNELYGEFSHRGLCSLCEHAQDMVVIGGNKKPPKNLLQMAARAWLEGLPDQENRDIAKKIMDPHIGMLNEGDTSHIDSGPLAGGFK